MGFVVVISDSDICWLQISMNIALTMNAVQPVHKLQCNNYDSRHLKLTFLERLFELF